MKQVKPTPPKSRLIREWGPHAKECECCDCETDPSMKWDWYQHLWNWLKNLV